MDESVINGGFSWVSAYNTYADINEFMPAPVLDAEGVRMFDLRSKKVGEFTFRMALALFPSYDGDWVAF